MGKDGTVRSFACDVCHQLVFFENTRCLTCGARLGFLPERRALMSLMEAGGGYWQAATEPPGGRQWVPCANAVLASCNWMVPAAAVGDLCPSCHLTRTRPPDDDGDGIAKFAKAEAAKRRLVFQLGELDLPFRSRQQDAARGLAFDLLTSRAGPVSTGHRSGIVTLDLAESDDAYREQTRAQLGEPYRTLLGHFRHEVGHYYWMALIEDSAHLAGFRALFGDDRLDYQDALDRHYANGPAPDWATAHVSAYATMHPWEDWAETFAHYLHIRDTIQTASAYGVLITGPVDLRTGRRDPFLAAAPGEADAPGSTFPSILADWLPLTYALNAVNRSMGRDDLYPFVIAPAVADKLAFVHDRILEASR
jgi:hypothetical protein